MGVAGNTNTSGVAMKKSELDEINKLRRSEGLPDIEPGVVKCLRCDNEFESWDKRNNRVCNECKADDDYGEQCEVYDLPEGILSRLNSTNMQDRFLLAIGYGYDAGTEDLMLLDTTLMDREDL